MFWRFQGPATSLLEVSVLKVLRAALLLVLTVGCAGCWAQPAPVALKPYWGNLDGEWLFRTDPHEQGIDEGWSTVEADDAAWLTLRAPGYWEPQGITDARPGKDPQPKGRVPWTDYDGVAWYRLHFTVPAEWSGQELILRLGSVDDYDQTYLNGRLVGELGPGVTQAVTVQRSYTVPADVAQAGRENVLAVRVTDGGGPGGLMGPALSLLPRSIAEAAMNLPQEDRTLDERFADPPAARRILKIVHGLPDDPDAQDELIRSLIGQGFGGMACNVSFEGYVESDEKWDAFVTGVTKAKQTGMSLWLYDELGYPSGTAGGITLRDHPEWEAQGLFIAEATLEGGRVELQLPPGDIVLVSAFPVGEAGIDLANRQDLDAAVANGALTWQAPPGQWHVMAVTRDRLFEGTHAAVSLHDNKPYINLLMPEPTARFIEVTHAEYARRLGDDLSPWFVSTFTDEPSLMSRFFKPMPYRVLPWAPGFADAFRQRRGYEVEPIIPALIADGPGCEKARYDFWLTVAELVSENYFGQIQRWCAGHGIASGGHMLLEEPICDHVPFYGDLLKCTRRLTAPSIDCLTSIPEQVPWRVARLCSSAGELNGTSVTMSEASDHGQRYRPAGDTRPPQIVTEEQIRGSLNRQMLNGINTFTSYYSFADLSTGQLRGLNEWVGRCCTMLKGGHQVADIAVLYPIESIWARFRPARQGATDSAGAQRVQDVFNRATDGLYQSRRDFTFIDSETLAGAQASDGVLAHRDLSWRVVVLPDADTLPLAAWENLARFWRQGGVVISVGSLPTNSETQFPSGAVQALAAEMFGAGIDARTHSNEQGGTGVFLPTGSEVILPLVLDRVLDADLRVESPSDASPIRVTHRRIDGHEVYFLTNESSEACTETVTCAAAGGGRMWEPATGRSTPIPDGPVAVQLAPYGGVFLCYENAQSPKRHRVQDGELPGLELSALPQVSPRMGKGEFVQADMQQDTEHEVSGADMWRTAATLTKSDVDTFLFVSFDYTAEPVDLSDVHCLIIDTWSFPPPQNAGDPEFFVIVRDADGAEYITAVGKLAASEGQHRAFLPLGSLDLAGWSKDADGRLDRTRISAINVGWGGYHGTEGEVIDFAAAVPKAGRAQKP